MSNKGTYLNFEVPAQPDPLIYHPELIAETADKLSPLEAELRELDAVIKSERPKLTVKRQAIKVLNQYAEIQVRMAFILGNNELWKMLGDKSYRHCKPDLGEAMGRRCKMKPILFNAEMVQAILDGRKTCTQRGAGA